MPRHMKLAVLFSGGKDSMLALDMAAEHHDIAGLITLLSLNPDSYMFHTPLVSQTALQAECMGLPHIIVETPGVKERELDDLKKAVEIAVEEWGVDGVVSGAVASVYQAARIQRVCRRVGVWSFNPLWQMPQQEVVAEVVRRGYRVFISRVAGYPLDERWLGRFLDEGTVEELASLADEMGLSPAGEGGEFETFVVDGPFFKRPLRVVEMSRYYSNFSGHVDVVLEGCGDA